MRQKVRELRFEARRLDVDDVLLLFGQIGLLSDNVFTVIAAYYQLQDNVDSIFALATALTVILQVGSSY